MQKITPFFWYETQAEEAANFYVSVFKNGKVTSVNYYPEGTPMAGQVLTVGFELFGTSYTALNGGPQFKFTEAVSFVVNCDGQAEVDEYWNKLTADGGEESMCGWLKDKYGLSWQIVPKQLLEMMNDKDKAKAQRVVMAMMQMRKIDIPTLQKAYDGN